MGSRVPLVSHIWIDYPRGVEARFNCKGEYVWRPLSQALGVEVRVSPKGEPGGKDSDSIPPAGEGEGEVQGLKSMVSQDLRRAERRTD